MTKARDLANIISGGFTVDDIPNLDTAKITSGTLADARFPATLPAVSGANLTNLPSGGVAGISSSADATAITIDSSENVGIGISPTPPTAYGGLHIHSTYPVMKLSSTATGSGTGDGFVARIDSTPRVELWNFENSDMVFATNNTERMRIRAGGGLAIGGTGDANTLDDYEEGTFTPTWTFSSGSVAYQYQMGRYTKIGRTVNVTLQINTAGVNSAAGDAIINGLPFTSDKDAACAIGFMYRWGTDFEKFVSFVLGENASTIRGYHQSPTAANEDAIQGNDFLNGSAKNICLLTLTYQTT